MKISNLLFVGVFTLLISCNTKSIKDNQKFIFKSGLLYDSNENIVASTIDENLQQFLDSILKSNILVHNANSACAVVMESKTGAIKAMSNYFQRPDGLLTIDSNLTLNHYYEFGGLFKLYSAMVLLDDGFANPNDSVIVEDGISMVGGVQIKDAHQYDFNKMSFKDGFIHSSNIVFAKLVYENYASEPKLFLNRFIETNLNKPLPLDIQHYNAPSFDKSNKSELPINSIGYSIKISPLHILTLYNSVANNGEVIFPYFTKNNNQNVNKLRICKTETASILKNFMESNYKTDFLINNSHQSMDIAGNSGTVNISFDQFNNFPCSYVGFFPSSNPKYTCLVILNNPKNGNFYGSSVAGPTFKEIANYLNK
jgi:cell division protein FtsI (penicillin-binding protein 3)